MKNTVTMAELMQQVQAYGQPQNLDEGFASDASRRAAFAQGYKAKGKKDKKEENLDEKLSTSQIGTLKKTFEPLRGKKIGPNAQKKLMQIMDKLDRDKDTLGQLVKADIPFVSQLAVTRLISKHNMTGAQINKLKEETLVEKDIKILVKDVKDRNFLKDLLNKAKDEKVMVGSPTPAEKRAGRYTFVGPKDKVNNVFNYAFDKSINRGNYAPATMMHEGASEMLDEVSRADANKINSELSKILGKIRFTHFYQMGPKAIFKLPKNVKHEVVVNRNDMKDAADLLMKDKGDVGFMFKQGQLRLDVAMDSNVVETNEMAYKPGSFKDTRPQEKGAKALADLAKTGGMDKKDFEKARSLYVQASDPASREKLKKFIFNLDTEPKEEIMNAIGLSDPKTFLQMYPNAKRGEPLTRVSFAHRNMKSEEVELEEKVDMQTKSYITDIVSAINRNPKLKYMRPFAKKFKDLAMKTGDVKKSLEAAMPDYVAGADIMRLLNMGDDILVRAAAKVLGEKLDKEDEPKVKKIIGKLKKASDAHAGQAKDLEKAMNEDGHTDVASAIRQCKTMIEDAMQITSKLQSMNPEESLPSWWTNKLAVSSNSMNKLRDYFLVPTTESLEDELGEKMDMKQIHKDIKDGMGKIRHRMTMKGKKHLIYVARDDEKDAQAAMKNHPEYVAGRMRVIPE